MSPPRLKMSAVQKAFGATRALRNVSIDIAPGEVHALIGENGAGKSTLMKILSGAHRADAGSITLDGEPFEPENPHHARRNGIAMIYQELMLAPDLSVEENILLGAEPARLGWLDRTKRRELARRALAELQHDSIPLDVPVNTLTIAEQQIVEIARALVNQPKVLIMDEPTSSLTQVDTENLFRVIARLRERGVSVIYISHFIEECQRVCQRYTVLRDGESVGTGNMDSVKVSELIRLMVGRDLSEIYPRTPHQLGKVVLELNALAGDVKPRNASFKLRAGEILGIAGLIGAGRTETLRALFGLDRVSGGAVIVSGREVTRSSPAQRLASGIGLLSENRKEEGLMLNRSVADNLTATRFAPVARCGFINSRRQREAAKRWIEKLEVRTRGPEQPIGQLSGGNQQKIAVGRLLHHDARVFLLDEPTRGIDVGSKAQIYRLMGELAAQGRSIIFVSSYLPELLGVCDTIAVMCRGVLGEVKAVEEWTEQTIIAEAVGSGIEDRGLCIEDFQTMTPSELSERLWEFSARIAKVIDALPDTRMGRHIAGQLCRSGTSSAPNYDEATVAESRADFAHKINIAWKEMRETRGWLRYVSRLGMLPDKRMTPLIDESEQLCRILSSSVATAKGKARRPIAVASAITNSKSSINNPQSPLHQ
ncbi:MAG TPA: four helix bundle protein [Candidatus Acidoferrum sp.]|nr:four helix bundle protein [Candidatus Acidoferrum sp.]